MNTNTYFERVNTNDYFESLISSEENNERTLNKGEIYAVRNYRYRNDKYKTYTNYAGIVCEELPYSEYIADFVKTMREAGVTQIAVNSPSTSLSDNLAEFVKAGCSIETVMYLICERPYEERIEETSAVIININ